MGMRALWVPFFLFSLLLRGQEKLLYLGQNMALRDWNTSTWIDSNFGGSSAKALSYCTNPHTGKLQFYTSGYAVYTADHQQVPSLFKLPGCPDPRQGPGIPPNCVDAMLLPKDTTEDSYYLIVAGPESLHSFGIYPTGSGGYEVRDSVCLLYGVTLNNTNLERIRTCDGSGFWVITGGNRIYAFYGTREGISPNPVISPMKNAVAQYGLHMRTSPDGRYLAVLYGTGHGILDVYRFEPTCGTFSFDRTASFPNTGSNHLGLDFSEDSRYLFASRNFQPASGKNTIARFDLEETDLNASARIWQFDGSNHLVDLIRVGNSLYLSWFSLDQNGSDTWISLLHDLRDTAPVVTDHYVESYDLLYFTKHEDLGPVYCQGDSFHIASLTINPGCLGTYIPIPVSALPANGDSLQVLLNGTPMGTVDDTVWLKPAEWGWQRLRIRNYRCGFPAVYERNFFVPPLPVPLPRDTLICSADPAILTGGPSILNHRWMYQGKVETDSFLRTTVSGTYVLEQSLYGCYRIDTLELLYSRIQIPELNEPLTVCPEIQAGYTLNLPAGKLAYYVNDTPVTANQVLYDTGFYHYRMIDSIGCEIRDSFVLSRACPRFVHFPDAFSPNGDGLNEVFAPVFEAEPVLFRIYDRWGACILEYIGTQPQWDGRSGGKALPTGVYIYEMRYLQAGEPPQTYRGTVTLIR